MSEEIVTAEELAALVDGKSDTELAQTLVTNGLDTSLDRIFDGMQDAFLPEKAAGKKAVVQWDVDTPEGVRSYQVAVADGACSTSRGIDSAPAVTLGLALPDFLRIITGKTNGTQAFMQGKLKIKGDLMLAQMQQTWFKLAG